MRRREDRLEEIVDELLESPFRGKQAREIDFGNHLGGPIHSICDRIGTTPTTSSTRPSAALARDIW
jgi:hypothetical protein